LLRSLRARYNSYRPPKETATMNRITCALISTGALLAVAAPAFAQDSTTDSTMSTEPTPDGDATANGGASGDMTGGAGAGGDMTGTATATVGGFPTAMVDRSLVIEKGKLAAEADLLIAHLSITIAGMTSSSTGEGLAVGGDYGVAPKLDAGAFYSFSLHDFEIKGTFTPFAKYELMHSDKLDVAAGANLSIDLNGSTYNATTMMTESQTNFALEAGLAVRYKVAPKIAVFTGNPFQVGPAGTHLKLGLSGDTFKSFDIPVGAGFQATPELFAYLETNVARIAISDPGMGNSRFSSFNDYIPLTLGGFFKVNDNIEAGAALSFIDLQNAGDFYTISLGARYFN
jgi:hypothetical protein